MLNNLVCFIFLFSSTSLCHAQILNELNNSKDESPIVIEAEDNVVCDETAHKCVATGKAKAQKGTNTVFGDILTVYFTEDQDITSVTADGHVRMETPTETAYGQHAHYDVALDRVLMTGGNLKIVTPKENLTAKDSIEYWHTENKGIARGHAIATFPEKGELIQADTLVAYFKPSAEKTEEGKEKMAIDHVDAEGNMLASSPKGVITGDRGVYFANTHMVEIFNNVKLTQDDNIIEGGYARHNLQSNVAEMFTQPPNITQEKPIKRIQGIINSKDAKKIKEKNTGSDDNPQKKHTRGQVFSTSAKTKQIKLSQTE